MLSFITNSPIYIKWNRPLISRTNAELRSNFKLNDDADIYRMKHYYCSSENEKKKIPVFSEFFLFDIPPNLDFERNDITCADFINMLWPDKKYKLSETEITLTIADQLLSKEMQCELYTNLLYVRQTISDRNKVVGINISYLNPTQCTIHMGATAEII